MVKRINFMHKVFSAIGLLFFGFGLYAQEQNPDTVDDRPRLIIEDFAYPRFLDREEHSYFLINYELKDNLEVELQGFYDTYLLMNRFRTSLALKRYLGKRFYLFAGVEVEMEFIKDSQWLMKRPPRVGVISGLGFDVNSNFSLEVKSNIGINQTSMGAYGETLAPMPQVYTLGGKIKF